MATLGSASAILSKVVCAGPSWTSYGFQQVRNKWTQWKTVKDMKRRAIVKQWAPQRLRHLALKKNDILPPEITQEADNYFKEKKIPNCTWKLGVTRRCVITSRGYGTVYRWRLSRFVFRHLSDYNKMAGVQRAMW